MDEVARSRLQRKLEEKLGAQQVTLTLLRAGHYLVAYELLKNEIIARTRDFYLMGFDEKEGLQSSQNARVQQQVPCAAWCAGRPRATGARPPGRRAAAAAWGLRGRRGRTPQSR